ncbi:MAG: HAD hydrolase-like protein [Candidatus Aegiribacteria sp.]|nr:HAD hydrolase-like protein [Candidatus Aegiribacteria sp.]
MGDAVIFDLDGTLLDTLDDICEVVNGVLYSNGMPTRSIDEVRSAVGRGVEELVRKLIPFGSATVESVKILSDQIRKTYIEHDSVRTHPYPGINGLLNRLKAECVPVAVLTNKPQDSAEKVISMYFGDFPFLAISGVEPGRSMKPSREAVTPVLEKLGALPGNTLMVGDSDVDMDTAVNAGMIAVGVSWGFRDVSLLLDHGAEYIVDSPMEIINLLGSGRKL